MVVYEKLKSQKYDKNKNYYLIVKSIEEDKVKCKIPFNISLYD